MLWYQRATMVVGAVVAVLLQVLLAPHIAIGYGIPSFPVVLCIVAAIMNPRFYSCLLPFAMGLAFDLVSGGPLGAMAFSLTAFSMGAAWFYERVNNDTVFMAVVNLAIGLLLVELCYGIFLLFFGYGTNPFEAFALRILPCFLYDLVLAVALYLIINRFFREDTTSQPMIKQLS